MSKVSSISKFLKDLDKRLEKAMPKIRREIQVFEKRKAAGKLTKNPIPGPQFHV